MGSNGSGGDWDLCLVLMSKQRNYPAVALMVRKGIGALNLLELLVESEYLVYRTIKHDNLLELLV